MAAWQLFPRTNAATELVPEVVTSTITWPSLKVQENILSISLALESMSLALLL